MNVGGFNKEESEVANLVYLCVYVYVRGSGIKVGIKSFHLNMLCLRYLLTIIITTNCSLRDEYGVREMPG